jgi:hypothetical protein
MDPNEPKESQQQQQQRAIHLTDLDPDKIREAALAALPYVMANPQEFVAPPAIIGSEPQAVGIGALIQAAVQIGQHFEAEMVAYRRWHAAAKAQKARQDGEAGVAPVPRGLGKVLLMGGTERGH